MGEDAEVIGRGKSDAGVTVIDAKRRMRGGGCLRFQI
jgi:hypothetical protein